MANALTTSFFFSSSLILSFFVQTKQDNPCPYPCYAPPTGTGGGGSGTQTGLYPPPGTTSYPTPTGDLPNNPPPPPPNGNSLYGQPPPDPILPYFPYYYRKPLQKTDDQSSATKGCPGKLLIMTAITTNLLVFDFCSYF